MKTQYYSDRHIGSSEKEQKQMLQALGCSSLESFIQKVIPNDLRTQHPFKDREALSEWEGKKLLKHLGQKNQSVRALLGLGYADTITPAVIEQNVLDNPAWYSAYTPYQPEISQGRLEALLNFQTMVCDLTEMEVANASLLDEATAAAEAVAMAFRCRRKSSGACFVQKHVFPQVRAVIQTRAKAMGIEIVEGSLEDLKQHLDRYEAVVFAYPDQRGTVTSLKSWMARLKEKNIVSIVTTDLLALTLMTPPGAMGADICVGSTQRFGVPLGYGGPHAAFLATRMQWVRQMPGRLIGISKDQAGAPALRLALQTREQHIRRERATSNICTAQVFLAVLASFYAVYHGPKGLKKIAKRIFQWAHVFQSVLKAQGYRVLEQPFFDTVCVEVGEQQKKILDIAQSKGYLLRPEGRDFIVVSFDEKTNAKEVVSLLSFFGKELSERQVGSLALIEVEDVLPKELQRSTLFLKHPVFHRYHTELEFLRYARSLEQKDLTLAESMIPLGSCTMKSTPTVTMSALRDEHWNGLHPFVPISYAKGYQELFQHLEQLLCELTGFDAFSFQPNAGSQGEFSGLLTIRAYDQERGETRPICLIPASAHGTNAASAHMAGFQIQRIACEQDGSLSVKALKEVLKKQGTQVGVLMLTYPSTHGIFEEGLLEVIQSVHEVGAQVYLDGANLNAQLGFCRPREYGIDVAHLNLHKTFGIPHGGGGPGVGPIGVKKHLAPYLPSHPLVSTGGAKAWGAVAAAPWGSALVLTISYLYLLLLGKKGIQRVTETALLNANYVAKKLAPYYPIVYQGAKGFVAHECLIDLRPIEKQTGVRVSDVAKRLMDYGFHAPTMSFPVAGTMMIEPTESESLRELDRFCEAMISIWKEIEAIKKGVVTLEQSMLHYAPHDIHTLLSDTWDRPYACKQAAFPCREKARKSWPSVGRIQEAYGDRHLKLVRDDAF